ncbi:MAG: hypothetical protein R3293_28955, partial [Candidatus Promineifilaceae bacterium]|nr:hypothetical protein [Candidatus Promineifilaceae bacterium]
MSPAAGFILTHLAMLWARTIGCLRRPGICASALNSGVARFLVLFVRSNNRTQLFERCFLGFAYAGDVGDIHASVRPGHRPNLQTFTGMRVPDPDRFIATGAGQQMAIRAEDGRENPTFV